MLTLLADVGEDQPLVCLVDDAQWLDRMSTQVLAFVARRLLAEHVALVFALRADGPALELAGLPELVVRSLRDADARTLLDSVVKGPLDPRVRARIVAETHGNPLALLELPRSWMSADGFAQPDGAREHLRTAHDMLATMGLEAFAERARRELKATGETVRKRTVETTDELTAQELQIARLAREGFSNPEIGTRLFLSPRTVEWHLRKVFGKLGITSRRQLRDAALFDVIRDRRRKSWSTPPEPLSAVFRHQSRTRDSHWGEAWPRTRFW